MYGFADGHSTFGVFLEFGAKHDEGKAKIMQLARQAEESKNGGGSRQAGSTPTRRRELYELVNTHSQVLRPPLPKARPPATSLTSFRQGGKPRLEPQTGIQVSESKPA